MNTAEFAHSYKARCTADTAENGSNMLAGHLPSKAYLYL